MNTKKEAHAMSTNKKGGIKLAVLSLVALFGLSACGETEEVYAKPSSYDDPIVTIQDSTEEIHHNVLSIIYDAMHEGNLSSNVLDEALYRYASSIFGYYNKVTAPVGFTGITLKEANDTYTKQNTQEKINAFIKEHKVYWNYNEEGKHVDDNGVEVNDETFTPCNAERDHVTAKYDAIEARIAEAMYGRAVTSSYTKKNYYCEKEFVRGLYENGDSVIDYKTVNPTEIPFDSFIIPYTVEKDEVFDPFVGYDGQEHTILNRKLYQSSIENEDDDSATFIEDEIIPDIYNDLLVEQYLLDEDVAAVRNSRARKINVLKIEKYSSFTNNADKLVEALVQEIYDTIPAANQTLRTNAQDIEDFGDELFEKYAKINKGLYDQIQADIDAVDIVTTLNNAASDVFEVKVYDPDNTPDSGDEIKYYANTTYGDLVKDYAKIAGVTDWNLLDKTKYSNFTSSGTRSIEEGFQQQVIDIMQSQSITKGWYIQSSTPSLDSNGTINDRLFKLSVANAKIELDDDTSDAYADLVAADRIIKDGNTWRARTKEEGPSEKENKFLCSINGAYFLKFEGQYSEDDWRNNIVYDDGSAYYIVQVLEAAKDSKLRNMSNTNYAHTRSQAFMDEVIDEIAKVVGASGSYATLSRNHWLEKMDLKYHDQVIYDYFKTNYPDLFD